jgi:hypothetical protein
MEPAVGSGDPENAPRTAELIGDLLVEHQDIAGAKTAYQAAIDSEHRLWPQQRGWISPSCSSRKGVVRAHGTSVSVEPWESQKFAAR